MAKRLDWHKKYLDYRALAERLRVQFFWQIAGVADESGTTFIHDNFLQKQDIEVGWIRNVMRFVSLTTRQYRDKPTTAGLDYVIDQWIGHGGRLAKASSPIMSALLAGESVCINRPRHLA